MVLQLSDQVIVYAEVLVLASHNRLQDYNVRAEEPPIEIAQTCLLVQGHLLLVVVWLDVGRSPDDANLEQPVEELQIHLSRLNTLH